MFLRNAVLALVAIAHVTLAAERTATRPSPGNVAPYYPSPMTVAVEMLTLGDLQPGELHYDLGSGDGRLVILAARDFGATSAGYEIDPKLVESSRRQIAEMELTDSATIIDGDLFQADFSQPDLITVYLLPRALKLLKPLFEEQLKPGARVVSHDFAIPGWEPDETITLDEETEIDGLLHTIYLYRR